MVQGYAVCPDCTDFLQQHGYGLVAEFGGCCLHQNTHENCKYKTPKLGVMHILIYKENHYSYGLDCWVFGHCPPSNVIKTQHIKVKLNNWTSVQ